MSALKDSEAGSHEVEDDQDERGAEDDRVSNGEDDERNHPRPARSKGKERAHPSDDEQSSSSSDEDDSDDDYY